MRVVSSRIGETWFVNMTASMMIFFCLLQADGTPVSEAVSVTLRVLTDGEAQDENGGRDNPTQDTVSDDDLIVRVRESGEEDSSVERPQDPGLVQNPRYAHLFAASASL